MKVLNFLIIAFLLLSSALLGCQSESAPYKTFTLNEGAVHFTVEYPSGYKIDSVHPATVTGDNLQRAAGLFLIGPTSRRVNDYTNICVNANPTSELFTDAKSLNERAEKLAASWQLYKLLYKDVVTIDGIQAYRLDYQNIDIVPAIAGKGEPGLEVFRRVDFDANGYVWTIYVDSPSTTAETDRADFEHVLETFKILD